MSKVESARKLLTWLQLCATMETNGGDHMRIDCFIDVVAKAKVYDYIDEEICAVVGKVVKELRSS